MRLVDLDVRSIRSFLALCDTRHFARAAKEVGLSAPAFTRQIQRVEEAAGGPLFARGSRDVELLPRGALILPPLKRALVALVEAEGLLSQRSRAASDEVRLGCVVSVGAFFVPHVLDALEPHAAGEDDEAPRVSLCEAISQALQVLLLNGDIDLALHVEPFEAPDVVSRRLWTEPFYLVGPPSLVEHASLVGRPWALPPSQRAEQWLRAQDLSPRAVTLTDNLATIRQLIETQGHLSVLPAIIARQPDWRIALHRDLRHELVRNVYLSHRGRAYLSPAAERVCAAVVNAAARSERDPMAPIGDTDSGRALPRGLAPTPTHSAGPAL